MEALLARLKAFDLEQEVVQILQSEEAFIADRNQENLMAGIDSTGRAIKPDYSMMTVRIKKAKGQPSDRVTLRDEGDFYSQFYVTDKFPMHIDSKNWKTGKLTEKYGENIFGLTEEKQNEVNRQILPAIIERIKALL